MRTLQGRLSSRLARSTQADQAPLAFPEPSLTAFVLENKHFKFADSSVFTGRPAQRQQAASGISIHHLLRKPKAQTTTRIDGCIFRGGGRRERGGIGHHVHFVYYQWVEAGFFEPWEVVVVGERPPRSVRPCHHCYFFLLSRLPREIIQYIWELGREGRLNLGLPSCYDRLAAGVARHFVYRPSIYLSILSHSVFPTERRYRI